MKQIRLHRIFLIMILALGMTGGSFITSMATVETDVVPADAAAVTEIAPEDMEQEEVLEETETVDEIEADTEDVALDSDVANDQEVQNVEPEEADVDVHGDDCEHCKAQAEKESKAEVEVIKAVQQVAPVVISTPATNSVASNPDSGESNLSPQKDEDKDKETLENQTPEAPPLPINQRLYEENKGSMAGHTKMYYCKSKEATDSSHGELEHYHCDACHRNFDVYKAEYEDVAKEIEIVIHVPGESVEENREEPTCEDNGSYDEVVRCTICEKELSKKSHVIETLGHTPGEPVIENEVEATENENGSYDEVIYCARENCKHEISRETIKVAVYIPKQVIIDDLIMGDAHVADIDDNGRAVIKGYFNNLKTGGSAKEAFTMEINGKSYTFTVYSDGTVSGKLPEGFSISGYDLIIKTDKALNIDIVDHTAASSISEDPDPDSGLGLPDEDGEGAGYSEPTIPEVPAEVESTFKPTTPAPTPAPRTNGYVVNEVVTAGTTTTNTVETNTANTAAGTNTSNTSNTTPAVTPAEEQVAAVEDALEVPSILADLLGGSHDADSADGSIGEEIGDTPSKLLIAADIALVAGLIVGLCALWKLGILKF